MNLKEFEKEYQMTYSEYQNNIYSKMFKIKPIERIYNFLDSRIGVRINLLVVDDKYRPTLSIDNVNIYCGEECKREEARKIVIEKALNYLEYEVSV